MKKVVQRIGIISSDSFRQKLYRFRTFFVLLLQNRTPIDRVKVKKTITSRRRKQN